MHAVYADRATMIQRRGCGIRVGEHSCRIHTHRITAWSLSHVPPATAVPRERLVNLNVRGKWYSEAFDGKDAFYIAPVIVATMTIQTPTDGIGYQRVLQVFSSVAHHTRYSNTSALRNHEGHTTLT